MMISFGLNIVCCQVEPWDWEEKLQGCSSCQAIRYLSHEDFSCFPTPVFRHSAPGSQEDHHGRGNVGNSIRWVGKGFQLSEIDLKKSRATVKSGAGLGKSREVSKLVVRASSFSLSHQSWLGSLCGPVTPSWDPRRLGSHQTLFWYSGNCTGLFLLPKNSPSDNTTPSEEPGSPRPGNFYTQSL